jgi:hypothetical protein
VCDKLHNNVADRALGFFVHPDLGPGLHLLKNREKN